MLTIGFVDDAGSFCRRRPPVRRRDRPPDCAGARSRGAVRARAAHRRDVSSRGSPARLPQVAGLQFDALYEPGRAEAQVGGDWYDAFRLLDGRVVISIGDVVGNGLAAATAMAEVRQSIRGAAAINPDPALLLDAADRTAGKRRRSVRDRVGRHRRSDRPLAAVRVGGAPAALRA